MRFSEAHSFYLTPTGLVVHSTEILRQHIHRFTDYFHKFRKAVEDESATVYIIKGVLRPILLNAFYCIKNVLKPAFIFNLFSHISELYRDWLYPERKGVVVQVPPYRLCDGANLLTRA